MKQKNSIKNNVVAVLFVNMITCVTIIYLICLYWKRKIIFLQQRVKTLQNHYQLLNHWIEIKLEGKSVASYFEDRGINHIAIYGMADLANRLLEDLDGSSIKVDYGIDKDVSCSMTRIAEVYFPEDVLPPTDAIVVTPYSIFETIKPMLEKRVTCPIISLEDIVWSV